MNKLLIYTVFFHILLFTSCYNEEVNLSKLKNSISENFIISSIEQRVNGEIYCIGEFKDNKIVEVRRYNQKFELQEKWQPGIILNLTGDMKIDHLNMGGWLISNNLKDSPKSLSIYKTDENFNILHQWNKIISNDAVLNLSALKELKNGDLMIAWDSITGTSLFNPSMVTFLKFNSKLDKIAEFYSSKSYSNYNSWSPRIT